MAESHNSLIYNPRLYNCDGQLTTTSPAGSWDNFGDGIYIAARNVTVENPYVETTQGGRAGIVYEGTSIALTGELLLTRKLLGTTVVCTLKVWLTAWELSQSLVAELSIAILLFLHSTAKQLK
ncbi:hypothetical protein SE959_07970 [Escherichia coli]|nr:hypothetical protein [Escherichia coli]